MKTQETQSPESMFIQLGNILTEMEWPHRVSTPKTTYSIEHTFFGDDMPLYITILHPTVIVATISAYPCNCPLDRISSCAELISLINWGLPSGNFEVHMKTGSIRFRDSANFDGTSIDDTVIVNMLESSHYNINYYAYAIYDFIFKNKSPQESLKSTKGG